MLFLVPMDVKKTCRRRKRKANGNVHAHNDYIAFKTCINLTFILLAIHNEYSTYQRYLDNIMIIFVCADLSTKDSGMTYPLRKCRKKNVRFLVTFVDIFKFLVISGSADLTTITTSGTNSENVASKF